MLTVPVIGDGTDDDPRRPDVPAHTVWVLVEDRGHEMVIDSPDALDLPQEDPS